LLRQQFYRSILFAPKWRSKLQLGLPQLFSLLIAARRRNSGSFTTLAAILRASEGTEANL
jgi:hypothetical protein